MKAHNVGGRHIIYLYITKLQIQTLLSHAPFDAVGDSWNLMHWCERNVWVIQTNMFALAPSLLPINLCAGALRTLISLMTHYSQIVDKLPMHKPQYVYMKEIDVSCDIEKCRNEISFNFVSFGCFIFLLLHITFPYFSACILKCWASC